MKKFFNFNKEKLKSRNSVIFVCVIALVCCIGVVNGKLSEKGALGVSAGYEEYEQEEMDAHSGEVLVDSLNLQAAEGTSEQNGAQEKESSASSASESSADGASSGDGTGGAVETVTSDGASPASGSDGFFAEARETLACDRNEMISILTDTISNTEDGSEKNSAQEQKERIIEYMNTEKSLENLIRNRGYSDAFVIVTDKSVHITIQAEELTDQDVAKILDIAMRETGRSAEEIVVQAKSA